MQPRLLGMRGDIVAVYKPAGLIVHSDGRTIEPSLADWVARHIPHASGVGEPWVSPQGEKVPVHGIVHRLDRTTSGVLLVATTDQTFVWLKEEFRHRRVEKKYRALVQGRIEGAGTVVAEIMRSSERPRKWYARPCEISDKRAAITLWRALASAQDPSSGETVTYVEAAPKTGRTHQIRVHFASIGHPLVADHLYAEGRTPILGLMRPALHAFSISFAVSGERVSFEAPLPDDLRSACRILGIKA